MRTHRVFYVVLILLLLVLGEQAIYRAAFDDVQRTDFTVYTAAGQALLNHHDIYLAENARGWRYVYPPPFAILLGLLARLPLWLGATIWCGLSIAAIGAAALMSAALLGDAPLRRRPHWVYGLPLLGVASLLISGILRSQASPFMYFFMIAALYFVLKERPLAAGFSLACATLLKVFPLVLIVYFIMRRQWRALLATALALVLLGLVLPSLYWGWQFNLDLIARWIDVVGHPAVMENAQRARLTDLYSQLLNTAKPRNQSLESLFLTLRLPAALTRYAVAASAVLMLGAMGAAARRITRARRAANRPDMPDTRLAEALLCGAFICWSLLVTPISETHYFGALLLPLTLLVGYADQYSPTPRRKAQYLSAGVLVMLAVMALTALKPAALWRPLCVAKLGLWWLCVHLSRLLARDRPATLG